MASGKIQITSIKFKPEDPIQALKYLHQNASFSLNRQKMSYNGQLTQIMRQHRGYTMYAITRRNNGLINMTNPSYVNDYLRMGNSFIRDMEKFIAKFVDDVKQELSKIDNPICLLQFTAPIEGNMPTDTGNIVSSMEAKIDNEFNEAEKYLSRVASIVMNCNKPSNKPSPKANSAGSIKLLENKLIINDNVISFRTDTERLRLVKLFFFDNGIMKRKSYPKDEAISRLIGEDWLNISNDRRTELVKLYQNARREINRRIKAETNIVGDFIIFTSNEEFTINKNLN